MDRKTMHAVAERLIFKAGSLVEFWSAEFEEFGEEPPCTAEEARVLLARWLQRLPGEAWDTRLDERKPTPEGADTTPAAVSVGTCCGTEFYSSEDWYEHRLTHTAQHTNDSGRLTLNEALEYADQMRRDATCLGLPNWPAPATRRLADVRRQNNTRRSASGLPVATCVHGTTARPDVTGDPVTACAGADGGTEWGAFNDEGCTYAYDCAVDVANESAKQNEEAEATADDPESTWREMCRDHRDQEQPKDGCAECNTEQNDEDEYDEPACEGHYDDDYTLTSGAGIGEPTYCDGSCNTR